jgi:hypothetical protein
MVLGRDSDGSVGLNLRDGNGKVRVLLAVQPDGKPVLQFLDDKGNMISDFTGKQK